jgi:hypothetical protein
MFSIQNKDETDFNGIESYVYEKVYYLCKNYLKVEKGDNSWFPVGVALCLQDEGDGDKTN